MEVQPAIYFSISSDNTPGTVARINAALLERNVSLRAIWAVGRSGNKAETIVVPEEPDQFKEAGKSLRWEITEGGCFWITGQDKTGALVDLLKKIAAEKLSIVALDAVAMDGKFGCYILASDEDYSAMAQLLGLRTALI